MPDFIECFADVQCNCTHFVFGAQSIDKTLRELGEHVDGRATRPEAKLMGVKPAVKEGFELVADNCFQQLAEDSEKRDRTVWW